MFHTCSFPCESLHVFYMCWRVPAFDVFYMCKFHVFYMCLDTYKTHVLHVKCLAGQALFNWTQCINLKSLSINSEWGPYWVMIDGIKWALWSQLNYQKCEASIEDLCHICCDCPTVQNLCAEITDWVNTNLDTKIPADPCVYCSLTWSLRTWKNNLMLRG